MTPASVSGAYFVFELFIIAFALFDYCEHLRHLVEAMSLPGWSKQQKEPSFHERNLSFVIGSFFLRNEVFSFELK